MLKMTLLPLSGGGMNPVIVDDGMDMLMIDCGMQDTMEELLDAAAKQNIDFSRLTRIIVTHHDHDHAGNLAALQRLYPAVQVIASAIDKDYIDGTVVSPRIAWSQKMADATADDDLKKNYENLVVLFNKLEAARVDIGAVDGQVFDWLGGVEIVATPGHLPGHIGVYLRALKTFITGDAMNSSNGALDTAHPLYTEDMTAAYQSTAKIGEYDVAQLVTFHGGVFDGDIPTALAALLEKYRALLA